MLENDGVGARSGINFVFGSARSQKKRNVRRSTSSRSAASLRLGDVLAQASSVRPSSNDAVRRRRAPFKLETDPHTKLEATRQIEYAIRLSEIRIVTGTVEV